MAQIDVSQLKGQRKALFDDLQAVLRNYDLDQDDAAAVFAYIEARKNA